MHIIFLTLQNLLFKKFLPNHPQMTFSKKWIEKSVRATTNAPQNVMTHWTNLFKLFSNVFPSLARSLTFNKCIFFLCHKAWIGSASTKIDRYKSLLTEWWFLLLWVELVRKDFFLFYCWRVLNITNADSVPNTHNYVTLLRREIWSLYCYSEI
jgi:hypothetical protein